MSAPADPQNQHAVKEWLDEMIASGRLKDCRHLETIELKRTVGGYGPLIAFFVPRCNRRSFLWNCAAMDDFSREEMLTLGMERGQAIISCPDNCSYYESRPEAEQAEREAQEAAEAKQRRERRWELFVRIVKYCPDWFSKLAWQIQALIIILLVLAISPKWVPQLILLIKALAGLLH